MRSRKAGILSTSLCQCDYNFGLEKTPAYENAYTAVSNNRRGDGLANPLVSRAGFVAGVGQSLLSIVGLEWLPSGLRALSVGPIELYMLALKDHFWEYVLFEHTIRTNDDFGIDFEEI